MEERPWPEYGILKKPITTTNIAYLLKNFLVHPKPIRFDAVTVAKGYSLKSCEDAFSRYLSDLPSQEGGQAVTRLQTNDDAALSVNRSENVTAQERLQIEAAENVTDHKRLQTANVTANDHRKALPDNDRYKSILVQVLQAFF